MLTVPVLWAALALGQTPNTHLAEAEKLVTELKYKDASGELDQAWQMPENTRAQVLRILELQGVVSGSLKQQAKAEAYFRKLASLDPSHEISGDYSPRVLTPFYEARSWIADHGALQFTALPATVGETGVEAVRAQVRSDLFSLAQRIRFHVRPASGPWNVLDQPLDRGQAKARIEAAKVEWWAELLGPQQAQLAMIGSESAPLVAEGKPKAAVAEVKPSDVPTKVEPVVTPPRQEVEATAPASSGSAMRPLAYGMGGVGVIAIGVGAYFGARSASDLKQIDGAARDSGGNVTGITQRQAFQLNQDSKTSATLGNALMAAGGGVVGVAVVFWLLGGSSQTAVSVGPAGVTVSGALP